MTKQKEFKLYAGPKRVLELLNQGFEGRVGLLAEALRKDQRDTSRIIQKLLDNGLINYTNEESDKRIRNYFITDEGKAILKINASNELPKG